MKNNMDQGDVDLSVLRKPILTSVTGFASVMRAFDEGTAELRRILERECDVIYECKVCRNIFRDVANLMTHKRLYCKTAFNFSRDFHFPDNGFIDQNISSVIEQEERARQSEGKRDRSSGESLPKDLGGLVHKMRMKQVFSGSLKASDFYELVNSKVTLEDVMQKKHRLHLQPIPESNAAVYQTVSHDEERLHVETGDQAESAHLLRGELMKREVEEVHKLSAKTDIVVGPNGRALKLAEFRETITKDEFEIESQDELLMLCAYDEDAESEPHECAICDARFATEKTLILHIRLKHVSSTKVYQCPSCSQTFLQAALVIKHLSNDHKKSLKKIRSMRDTIHRRHMRLDEVQVKGPSRELHRLQTEKARIEAENNKAYLDNVANLDGTKQSMCTYCNKIFERKAVLTSHMVNCRIKFEKTFLSVGGNSSSAASTNPAAKRTPKPGAPSQKENHQAKEGKEVVHDENSSSSSDGGAASGSALPAIEAPSAVTLDLSGENSNGSASSAAPSNGRKRKLGRPTSSASGAVKRTKKTEGNSGDSAVQQPQQEHSKVSELLPEKPIWNAATGDEDESYFSLGDKAPEEERHGAVKRRFPCDTCNKSFSTSSNLKRHNVMFHYFQSRYRCLICGYRALNKAEALLHLREEHQMDKEEHEMKVCLEQEKNEVSSSEVLDLDLDEGSSNQGRSSSTGRDNSGTNSPVPHSTATHTPVSAQAHNNSGSSSSSSSGLGSATSSPPAETPPVPRKRGRPKGSFKVKPAKTVPAPAERPSPREEPLTVKMDNNADSGDSRRASSLVAATSSIPPLPPQVDNNSSSSSTSSRPIRNRTKPKDKDFVYDYASLKGDFLFEEDAMQSALNESMLAATASSPNSVNGGTATPPEFPAVKIQRKRSSATEQRLQIVGLAMEAVEAAVPQQKRGVGRPKLKKEEASRQRQRKFPDAEAGEPETTLKPNQHQRTINWEKNVIIPTRIIEHRHSVGGLVGLKKEETRRNSIEIMTTKSSGGAHEAVHVKENSRFVASPLGVIENLLEARAVQKEGDLLKDDLRPRHFVADSVNVVTTEPHILLNGRSLELNSMLTLATAAAAVEHASS